MKQRLGVAAALLGDPALLILDEPTNGLDPAGMADMRDLIRSLAGRGQTVMLSSHLLGEVEQICDRVGVIADGRLLVESSVTDLRGHATLSRARRAARTAAAVAERLVGRRSCVDCGRSAASGDRARPGTRAGAGTRARRGRRARGAPAGTDARGRVLRADQRRCPRHESGNHAVRRHCHEGGRAG